MKVMETEGLRTVDCLRGRLLAERVASKAAKENAELLNKRLMEIERHVVLEIELAKRAEKRLKFALRKLESLKLSDLSSRSSWSENEISGSSSSLRTGSGLQKQSDENRVLETEGPRSCDTDGLIEQRMQDISISDYAEDDNSMSSSAGSILQFPSPEGSWYSAHSQNDEYLCQDGRRCEEFGSDALRESSNGENDLERERVDIMNENKMLAFVPVEASVKLAPEQSPIINSIQDVLVALRHAKERLQSSVERRVVA
ncbi:hypothetical protein QJS10_CPB20g00732 [Acorus calamus]|uniref:Uncharacterized protein n=1 Tax=Acorus calamus TaxID=4465 RepID=A0AAV9CEW9_ACOCL|nr:hypothetical protein QJS10_CPB20g00732 [Acorus calamus]